MGDKLLRCRRYPVPGKDTLPEEHPHEERSVPLSRPGAPRAGASRRYYHPLPKDYATFLKTSEETGGEYTLIEVEVAPEGGTELHYHKTYDEHFEVVEGTLEV
jgi:mannose-6-phosphate isomerase-like protein (cupin superfamily)